MTDNPTTTPRRIHPLTVWLPVIFIALGVVLFYNYLEHLKLESLQNHLPILSRLEKNIALDERSGKRVGLKELKGKILVASWVYTHCPRGCAGVIGEMRSVFNDLKKSAGADAGEIHFLSFSLDPDDTPKDMKAFTDKFKIEGDNWWFLTGPKDEVRPYMSKYFGFHAVEEVPVEKRLSPDDKFVHDMRVALVDDKAQVRGFYDIASPEKEQREFMQEKLHADVLKLLKERDILKKSNDGKNRELSFILYVLLVVGSIAFLVWQRLHTRTASDSPIFNIAFSYKGRISRQTFWAASICLLIANAVFVALLSSISETQHVFASYFLVVCLLVWLPFNAWISLAVQVKRWHDLGISGWAVFINLVPGVNIIVFLIILGCMSGKPESNKYDNNVLSRPPT